MNKKEELFTKLFRACQTFVGLGYYVITINFDRDEDDDYDATMVCCDYTHFSATISFSKEMLDKIYNPECLWNLMIHELMYIYTSSSMYGFQKNEEMINDFMGKVMYTQMYNQSISISEQMTQFLDRVISDCFHKTKEFKEIKKLCKANKIK